MCYLLFGGSTELFITGRLLDASDECVSPQPENGGTYGVNSRYQICIASIFLGGRIEVHVIIPPSVPLVFICLPPPGSPFPCAHPPLSFLQYHIFLAILLLLLVKRFLISLFYAAFSSFSVLTSLSPSSPLSFDDTHRLPGCY